jgi:hypothetical protein
MKTSFSRVALIELQARDSSPGGRTIQILTKGLRLVVLGARSNRGLPQELFKMKMKALAVL